MNMDNLQSNQTGGGMAQNDDHETHSGSHAHQQPPYSTFGDMNESLGVLDQNPTLDDFSNAPFDYTSLSNLYIPKVITINPPPFVHFLFNFLLEN